jgi:hypothetical protein
VIAELIQRAIDMYRLAAVGRRLLEGWQHHGSARRPKRLEECLVSVHAFVRPRSASAADHSGNFTALLKQI